MPTGGAPVTTVRWWTACASQSGVLRARYTTAMMAPSSSLRPPPARLPQHAPRPRSQPPPAGAFSRHRRVLVSIRLLGIHAAAIVDRVDQRADVGHLLLSGAWPYPRGARREPRAGSREGRRPRVPAPVVPDDMGLLVVFRRALSPAGESRALQRNTRRRGTLARGDGRNERRDHRHCPYRALGNRDTVRSVEFTPAHPHRAREGNGSARAAICRRPPRALWATPTSPISQERI